MEVGGKASWPYPVEWGYPKVIPDAARLSDEAAARFMAEWARYQIRKRQPRPRLTGQQALMQMRLRELRGRLLEG